MQAVVERMLSRYRSLLPDWDAFLYTLSQPLAQCVAINPLRTDIDTVVRLLGQGSMPAERIAWHAGALRLPAYSRPGTHWGFCAGLFSIQEEASLLPVALLGPAPGLRVLDLCAAPGGKTTRIALALGNRGTVIANDAKRTRLGALGDAVRRMGLLNVTVSCHDGSKYPAADGQFDRVLVDAPCSSEGTVRKVVGNRFRPPGHDFRQRVVVLQRALLCRAVQLCRPGGRVVYSTCTFAPEENEAVVSAVLAEFGPALRVLPVSVDGIAAAPGLREWDGSVFHPDLVHACRLWPQRSATGGFFAVALQRVGGAVASFASVTTASLLMPDLAPYVQRFGLPSTRFDELRFFRQGRFVRACASDHLPPAGITAEFSGIAFERHAARRAKLTTTAATLFAQDARRNVVEVDGAGLAGYLARRDTGVSTAALAECDGDGHVLVRHQGVVVGIGLLRREATGARLISQFPKAWSGERFA